MWCGVVWPGAVLACVRGVVGEKRDLERVEPVRSRVKANPAGQQPLAASSDLHTGPACWLRELVRFGRRHRVIISGVEPHACIHSTAIRLAP